jgi:DNA-binding transcriptional LysR family regulator
MDKLTALRVFCRVADLGSFAAAARDLDLSDAAVGKNVRELEAELATRLINRTTRKLHLTEAGQTYLVRARQLLSDLAEADASIKLSSGDLRGNLRIAAPMTIGLTRIAPAVSSFLLAHSAVSIDLELDDRKIDIVENGFDLAIRGTSHLRDSSLLSRRIAGLDRIVCTAPVYLDRFGPIDGPADLSRHTCLIYSLSEQPGRWKFERLHEERVVDVSGPLRMNNSLALAASAAAGLGIARLPVAAAERWLADGTLTRVCPDWRVEPGDVYTLIPKHREASPLLRQFVEHLASAMRQA